MKQETDIQTQLEAVYQELMKSGIRHRKISKMGTKKQIDDSRMEMATLAVQATTLEWVLEMMAELPQYDLSKNDKS